MDNTRPPDRFRHARIRPAGERAIVTQPQTGTTRPDSGAAAVAAATDAPGIDIPAISTAATQELVARAHAQVLAAARTFGAGVDCHLRATLDQLDALGFLAIDDRARLVADFTRAVQEAADTHLHAIVAVSHFAESYRKFTT